MARAPRASSASVSVCIVITAAVLVMVLPASGAWSASDGSSQVYRYTKTTDPYAPLGSPDPTGAGDVHTVPGTCQIGLLDCLSVGGLRDDETSTCLAIPFSFTYYGTVRTCVNVAANGYLYFGPIGGGSNPNPYRLPMNGSFDMVAPFWTDLVPSACGGGVAYRATASEFTVEWNDVAVKPLNGLPTCTNAGTLVTMQVRLEANGDVIFSYQAATTRFATNLVTQPTRPASIGIQGGKSGLSYLFSNPATADSGLLFSANAAPTAYVYPYTPCGVWKFCGEDRTQTIDVYGIDREGDGMGANVTALHGSLDLLSSADSPGYLSHVLRYKPNADYNGPETVTATITDAFGKSTTATYSFNLIAVNDAPVVTVGANLTVGTNGPLRSSTGFFTAAPGPATATDEANQTLTTNVTVDHAELFKVVPAFDAAGTLTFRAGKDVGTAVVTVRVTDNGGHAVAGSVDTTTVRFSITLT